ncbi:MAG: ERMES complex subunit [Chaenotheca gracillima]|nr:MAG: ERMES complex subunit [Chaenotheca gracillima]
MERVRGLFRRRRSASYEPLEGGSPGPEEEHVEEQGEKNAFSWVEYSIFLLLGVAMLWAWNMFLAAAPYFQSRFRDDKWILSHFQSAIISVSTVMNLGSMIVLTKLQSKASYPRRIASSLVLNAICFTLLAFSTRLFLNISPSGYLVFLLSMVLLASLATGFSQNGVFAFVSGYGRGEYTQAIMTGQAVAGVLPCIAQIVSVLSVPPAASDGGSEVGQESSTSAFSYFLTATGVSVFALLAFVLLVRRQQLNAHPKRMLDDAPERNEVNTSQRQPVGFFTLFRKLSWLAAAVFLCFGITMFFPVFTQAILSVRPPGESPRLLKPATFIPLAFLFWNAGDLVGRLLTLIPSLSFTAYPKVLFAVSISRVVFIPLYELCNVGGRGAAISSDFFYLVIVQLMFGVTNGWLGSSCMMGAHLWVEPHEAEAAGGFMGLMLVAGLTVGSLLSFLVSVG